MNGMLLERASASDDFQSEEKVLSSGSTKGEKRARFYSLEQSRFAAQSFALYLGQHDQAGRATALRSRLVHLGWHQHLLYHKTRYAEGKKSRSSALGYCPCRGRR